MKENKSIASKKKKKINNENRDLDAIGVAIRFQNQCSRSSSINWLVRAMFCSRSKARLFLGSLFYLTLGHISKSDTLWLPAGEKKKIYSLD